MLETLPIIVLVASFALMLAINVPVAICIGVSTLLMLLATVSDASAVTMARDIAEGMSPDALLAIPFFIVSGMLMGKGGMARRLIDFANALVGRFPGGLCYVNVLTCMMFGSISGSAAAAVSSVGGFMIPQMKQNKYDADFSVALTSTAATTGLLIPPSNVMIVYSLAAGGVSVGALFLAGVFPGIICGLALMMVAGVFSVRRGYGGSYKASAAEVAKNGLQALPSLALVIIVIGGIVLGVFSATEGSAVAVLYSVFLTVFIYKEIKFGEIPKILLESGITAAIVMIIIGCSKGMSTSLTAQMIPQKISAMLMGISDNMVVTLLIMNAMLLIVGTFMDMSPAILIFTPILYTVFRDIHGIHPPDLMGIPAEKWLPIHFGTIIIANLCIGLCTPPVGTCLFLGCGVGKTKIADTAWKMFPFFIAMLVALMLITFIPEISIALPKWLGLL